MDNKNMSPTIEQSLKMIEEKLQNKKKNKMENKNTTLLKKNTNKDLHLSNLFKKEENKKKTIKSKHNNVLLLTKKVDDKGKVIKPKKDIIEKKKDEEIDLNIKSYKSLSKTSDLAIIIKKLKKIRDVKLNNNKKENSKKTNEEIIKLNETIDLAEDLFKKELLDL